MVDLAFYGYEILFDVIKYNKCKLCIVNEYDIEKHINVMKLLEIKKVLAIQDNNFFI